MPDGRFLAAEGTGLNGEAFYWDHAEEILNCTDCIYNNPDNNICTAPKEMLEKIKNYDCWTDLKKR